MCIRRTRVERDRVLELLERGLEVVEAGGRVAEHDLRGSVARVLLQDGPGARARILVLPRGEEQVRGLELEGEIVGQQVGRADGLAIHVPPVADDAIGLGELAPGLAELRVLLQRVPVLHDRFARLVARHEPVAAGDVVTLDLLGILRATCGGQDGDDAKGNCRTPDLRSKHDSPVCGREAVAAHTSAASPATTGQDIATQGDWRER